MVQEWPDQGVVKFENYSTRYRTGLDLVVKDISCNIAKGEKVSKIFPLHNSSFLFLLIAYKINTVSNPIIYVPRLEVVIVFLTGY